MTLYRCPWCKLEKESKMKIIFCPVDLVEMEKLEEEDGIENKS